MLTPIELFRLTDDPRFWAILPPGSNDLETAAAQAYHDAVIYAMLRNQYASRHSLSHAMMQFRDLLGYRLAGWKMHSPAMLQKVRDYFEEKLSYRPGLILLYYTNEEGTQALAF
jgi:hypothetical protein